MADVRIHPRVRPEADGFGNGEKNAGIPVDDDQDVKYKIADTEDVGIVSSGLSPIEELKETRHFEQSVEA